jgi:hypothetical protein
VRALCGEGVTCSRREVPPEPKSGASGAMKRKAAKEKEIAKEAQQQPCVMGMLRRGGAEAPEPWHLDAESAAKVVYTQTVFTRRDVLATADRPSVPPGAAVPNVELICLRTFGSGSMPECGFNCLLGAPSERTGVLRRIGGREQAALLLESRRASLSGLLTAMLLAYEGSARCEDGAEMEAARAVYASVPRPGGVANAVFATSTPIWEAYKRAIRMQGYQLCQEEVSLIALALDLNAAIWCVRKGGIESVYSSHCDALDADVHVVLKGGHYERAYLRSKLEAEGWLDVVKQRCDHADPHACAELANLAHAQRRKDARIAPAAPDSGELRDGELWEFCDTAALERWIATGLDRRPEMAKRYLEAAKVRDGWVRAEYTFGVLGRGRRYARGLSMQKLTKEARAAACATWGAEADISNAFPTIVAHLAHMPPRSALREYVAQRDAYVAATAQHFSVPPAAAKTLFLSILFSGSVHAWRARCKVQAAVHTPAFIEEFAAACAEARRRIATERPGELEEIRRAFPDRWNPEATLTSYVVGTFENACISRLSTEMGARGCAVRCLLFDGAIVSAATVGAAPDRNAVYSAVRATEEWVHRQHGVQIMFKVDFPELRPDQGMSRPAPWHAQEPRKNGGYLEDLSWESLRAAAAETVLALAVSGGVPSVDAERVLWDRLASATRRRSLENDVAKFSALTELAGQRGDGPGALLRELTRVNVVARRLDGGWVLRGAEARRIRSAVESLALRHAMLPAEAETVWRSIRVLKLHGTRLPTLYALKAAARFRFDDGGLIVDQVPSLKGTTGRAGTVGDT